jgi:hypothetical protein
MPAVPPTPPRWHRAATLSAGFADSVAVVIVQVISARDSTPVENAQILLGPRSPVPHQALSDSAGHAVLRVPSGRVSVLVHALGFPAYSDTVTVRAGYADTLRLGLGRDRVCFT